MFRVKNKLIQCEKLELATDVSTFHSFVFRGADKKWTKKLNCEKFLWRYRAKMGFANEEMGGNCFVCSETAKSRCSACLQAFYCCADHQRKDWKNHKAKCSPMRVCHNEKIGRHYVATRNIKPGEIVLRELPLIIGPSQVTQPVCVGCLQVNSLK